MDEQNNPIDNNTDTKNRNLASRPSFPIRMWRGLLRRRTWRKYGREGAGHVKANWAEKTTVIVTVGILIVGGIQAYIYWKQETLMQSTLNQNERGISLNTGQLTVANRNATTAENTYEAGQKQFRDEQRPYIWLSPGVAIPGQAAMTGTSLPDLKRFGKSLIVQIGANNGGHSPAVDVVVTRPFLVFDTNEKAKQIAKSYIAKYIPAPPINLAPNAGFLLLATDPLEITDQMLIDLQSGHKQIYVLARVQYRDIFVPRAKEPYETALCVQIHPAGNPSGICDIGESWIK